MCSVLNSYEYFHASETGQNLKAGSYKQFHIGCFVFLSCDFSYVQDQMISSQHESVCTWRKLATISIILVAGKKWLSPWYKYALYKYKKYKDALFTQKDAYLMPYFGRIT